MGRCVGYIGWRVPQVARPAGEHPMELMEPNEPVGQIIFPKLSARSQRLVHVGERTESDPALITCHGTCGKAQVKWTWHFRLTGASYQCRDCSTTRKWGLSYF